MAHCGSLNDGVCKYGDEDCPAANAMTTDEREAVGDKVIRDGKVAVLVSPGFGAGWYSWNSDKDEGGERLLFDAALVAAVEAGDWDAAECRANEISPNAYLGGLHDLEVEWVPVGVKFKVIEFDGNEELIRSDDDDRITA